MLRIESVTRTFPNGTEALAPMSLDADTGEIIAIVGGSGCGKSTLLRIAAGLDRPTTGSVGVDGETIIAPHPYVGIVFQEPRLLPWLTVSENVGFGLSDVARTERTRRIDQVLSHVGLSGYGSRWPKELSGGQAQRVALARVFVTRPRAILMDEPFSALDAFTRESLHDLVRQIHALDRPTLILVTHEVDEAVALAHRVVVMQPKPGRIFADIRLRPAGSSPTPLERPEEARRKIRAALSGSLTEDRAQSAANADAALGAGLWW